MSDSLRPTNLGGIRQHSVSLDGGAPGMQHRGLGGLGQQGQMTPAVNIVPGSNVKALLQGAGTSSGAAVMGFNWKAHAGGLEHNDVLSGMLEGGSVMDPGTIDYYIGKVEDPMIKFFYYMQRRETPVFYQNFLKVRENFVLDIDTGYPDPIKKDFLDAISKMSDFIRVIAYQGMVVFGYLLVEELRRSNKQEWTETDFNNAVQIACSHILYLEFLNWLFNTKKGKTWTHRLPKKLEQKLQNLEPMKEQFSLMWEMFDAPFPYGKLDFVNTVSTPVEYARVYDPDKYAEYLGYIPQQANGTDQTHDPEGILAMIQRNAGITGGYENNHHPQQAASQNNLNEEVGMSWGNIRNDLENINNHNMREFDVHRYFKPTGRENHYFIPESDWRFIKTVFKRHPDMKQECGLMSGCFRIVVIDLQANNGWFSHVVRDEDLDVSMIMSNPAKLLPLLDTPKNDSDAYMVIATPLEDVALPDKLEVPLARIKELGKGIPAITIDENIVEKESSAVAANVNLITGQVTKHIKTQGAAIFTNLTEWNVYECESAGVKTRLFQDVAFLFSDSDLETRPSFYKAGLILKEFFNANIVDREVCNFINGRLTEICNQWLVNECGYNVVDGKGGGGKLQIENMVADIQALADFLKKKDEMAYNILMDGDSSNYLTERLKIFHKTNIHLMPREEMGTLDKLKDDVNLYVIRQFYMANVVNNKGPLYEEVNVPIYIKRSAFPEIFRLMEIVVEFEGEEDAVVPYRDKLLRYGESNNVWLYSRTLDDKNVATLRHVNAQKPMVLLAVN